MKDLVFVGSSRKDIRDFPKKVKVDLGFALQIAQWGGKAGSTKPLKGFHGAGVLEVVGDFEANVYRAVYTVRFEKAVYVLHCFQKKSKHGIKTPQKEMERVWSQCETAGPSIRP